MLYRPGGMVAGMRSRPVLAFSWLFQRSEIGAAPKRRAVMVRVFGRSLRDDLDRVAGPR